MSKGTDKRWEEEIMRLRQELEQREEELLRLRASEERLRAIAETAHDSIFCKDVDRRYTFVNPAMEGMLGGLAEELLGKTPEEIFDPVSAAVIAKVDQQNLQGEAIDVIHSLSLGEEERIFHVIQVPLFNDEGEVGGISGIVRDITALQRAEEEVRESERRYHQLFNQLTDAAVLADVETGDIVDVNEQAERLFGRSREELLTLHQSELHPLQHRETTRTGFQQDVHQGGGVTEMEILRADGAVVPVILTSAVRILKERRYLLGLFHDISERKQLENQLRQAQKMEAIGILAGGVAHDFNNLLMGIQGNVSLLLYGLEPQDPSYEKLLSIEQCVRSGSTLSQQLLGFARGGKYNVQRTDMNQILKESAEDFLRKHDTIQLYTRLAPQLWPVEVDQEQMRHVLGNLYQNALQAMPQGGKLLLSSCNVELEQEEARPYRLLPGRYVRFSVEDTGVGMSPDIQPRIFEPFFTTKERRRGTGLGLASAYGILLNHGGMIRVESEEGKGSAFCLYLPVLEGVSRKREGSLSGEEPMVLVVDDEEMILEVARQMIDALGYRVLTAQSGLEALHLYRQHQDTIELVILDLVMPELDGGETYDRLKQINPQVRCLLSSGYSAGGQARHILQRGCDGFLQKPFNLQDLSQRIEKLLGAPPRGRS